MQKHVVTKFWLHHFCTFVGVGGWGGHLGRDRVSKSHFGNFVNGYWRSRPRAFAGAEGPRPKIFWNSKFRRPQILYQM